ncbi:hypothetical protein ACF1D2_33085 [Streptomyces bacillaris]|uniref:hypothetical protein n=1 Tax=Streptomyces bacillaris TaxID=68179 RepID=UPI0036F617A9
MRTTTVAVALLAAAALTACSSNPTPPAYTVVNQGERELDLGTAGWADILMPDATVNQAQDAIRTYGQTIRGDATMYTIAVVHDTTATTHGKPATTYVCMGRWVKDEQASRTWADSSITSDTWPAIGMNCPDRKG